MKKTIIFIDEETITEEEMEVEMEAEMEMEKEITEEGAGGENR